MAATLGLAPTESLAPITGDELERCRWRCLADQDGLDVRLPPPAFTVLPITSFLRRWRNRWPRLAAMAYDLDEERNMMRRYKS